MHGGQIKEAVHSLMRMRRLGAAGAAALASGGPHRIVMRTTAKVGNARATSSMLAEMKAQGLPDTSLHVCYNEALKVCAKAPRRTAPTDDDSGDGDDYLSEARALFKRALQARSSRSC
jgi:hypothetical protein